MNGIIHIVCRYTESWIDGGKVTKVVKTPYDQVGCCHKAIIDYDNGTTETIDAVIAIEILFDRPQQAKAVIEDVNNQDDQFSPEMKALLSQKVEELDMSVRLRSVLKANGIDTVLDLCRLKKTDCLKFRNAGKKSLMALDDFITAHNLTWGMNV